MIHHYNNARKRTYSPYKKAAFTLAEGATHVALSDNQRRYAFTHAEVPTHVAHSDNTRRAAFTLAEVLITLGIIGVVAAMTMPTLITNHQKEVTAKRLEQTYSILSQAMTRAQADHGDVSSWGFVASTPIDPDNQDQQRNELIKNFLNYIVPYLKLSSDPVYDADITKFGYQNPYHTKSGETYTLRNVCLVELANGVPLFVTMNWNYDNQIFSTPLIYVDINAQKGPNVAGRDLFLFYFDGIYNMKLQPWGATYSTDVNREKCSKEEGDEGSNNLHCTSLIMKSGWRITDDYPW